MVFLIVRAFRAFWLSGHSSFPVVLTFLWYTALKNKFKKEKRGERFTPKCLFAKKLPINFSAL
jgi:hypothetical protein